MDTNYSQFSDSYQTQKQLHSFQMPTSTLIFIPDCLKYIKKMGQKNPTTQYY